MLTTAQMQQAINNLNILIAHYTSVASSFSCENEHITKNWFFIKSKAAQVQQLNLYLQKLIDEVSDKNVDCTNRLYTTLFITLQNFLHLQPNRVLEDLHLNLTNKKYLERRHLIMKRLGHLHSENQFKNDLRQHTLPEIQYDRRTGYYTSPDDTNAHQHGYEAQRIFFATQWDRFKGLCHWFFAKIGIHVFEASRYKEHDYLDSDIYAHDPAIKLGINTQKTASHYWIGHASNLITLPSNDSPLHIVTDPVEGDLAPFLYPRMTEEGSLIDGTGSKKLPKIDVVIISHNHRDHVSQATLQRLVKQQPKMIVPEGDEPFFVNLGFNDVVGLKWWEQAKVSDTSGNELLRVTAVPARHWSGRSLADAHRSAFNGYVFHSDYLEGDIYFAGDTALMDNGVSDPIFEKFNIITSIQPGGPDERREDMESTHQSSADGILIHFKILAAQYKKMKEVNEDLTLEAFLSKNQNLKTLYNHTATFKLGNLRLRDTYYSYQRMIAAFQEGEQWRADHLPKHEQDVYDCIQSLVRNMVFKGDQQFNNSLIAHLILKSVVIPKIGQRQSLYFTGNEVVRSSQRRHLITNNRALLEYDTLLQEYIAQQKEAFNVKQFILNLLNTYQRPWHAFFSRTYKEVKNYEQDIRDCQRDNELLDVINRIETHMGKRNQHGHMQSLIYYAKWVLEFSNQHQNETLIKFKEYFTCQQVRRLVDQEIHRIDYIASKREREDKQQLFQVLSDQLADLPEEVEKYRKVISDWLATRTRNNQSTQQLFSERSLSFFAHAETSREAIVQNPKTTLGM